MRIVELIIRKKGRIRGREACLAINEGVTLTGKFPTRKEELEAQGFQVERRIVNTWPKWALRRERTT